MKNDLVYLYLFLLLYVLSNSTKIILCMFISCKQTWGIISKAKPLNLRCPHYHLIGFLFTFTILLFDCFIFFISQGLQARNGTYCSLSCEYSSVSESSESLGQSPSPRPPNISPRLANSPAAFPQPVYFTILSTVKEDNTLKGGNKRQQHSNPMRHKPLIYMISMNNMQIAILYI